MRCIYRLLAVMAILHLFYSATAQQTLFRNYSVLDGLSSNTVWCINQDEKGYMWFGTKNGICRFDGYQFKSYQFNKNNPNSLGNNFIIAVTAFDHKTYWVATQDGVYILDLERETFKSLKGLEHISVYDILRDRDGNMWIATRSRGVFHYHSKSGFLKNYRYSNKGPSISSDHTRKIVQDKWGRIWIGTFGEGVDVFDPVHKTLKNYNTKNSALSNNYVLTLYPDMKGNVWIGTFSGGLNVWSKDSHTFTSYRKSAGNSINDDIVRAIYQPAPDKLYIGTEKGLNELDLTSGIFSAFTKKTNDPFSLSDNAIYSICPDREGGIWVGTFFGGVNYFKRKSSGFELYYPNGDKQSLSGNAVSSFLEDSPGKFWIGTEDGGLNYFNSADRTFKQYPFEPGQQKLSYHNIHSLYKDRKGNIWIGTFAGGLNIFNPSTGKVKNYKNRPGDSTSISNDNIYSIYEDKDGEIWVGTTKGLNKYDPATDSFKHINVFNFNENIIYDIYEDDTRRLWFATYDIGLISFNRRSGKWQQYEANGKKDALSSNKIICILDDHSGNLWLGTDGGGLNRLNLLNNKVEVFDGDSGLHGNVVYGILQDDDRNLWLSTNNGLYNFRINEKTFIQYTNWDYLQSRQFNYKAFYKSSSGKFYFGGIKGFNSFYPDSIRTDKISKKVTFTNFQLFNKDVQIDDPNSPLKEPINYSNHITLSHDQSVIGLEYAALSYTAPNKTQYAYKMDGFDKNWNYVGNQRKATYTNLPAGEYTFRVKASSDPSHWNMEDTHIRITIKPPFHKTVWAYLIYCLLAIAGFMTFRTYLINKTRRENQIKLERIKTKKEQEFYVQKMEFFIAMAHEIRTPLSLIMAPLEKLLNMKKWDSDEQKQLSVMDENSNRLLNLVNQLLDFRRIESDIYNIHKEDVELLSLIHIIYSRFSAIPYQKGIKFTLSTKISKLMVQVDPEAYTKILNNLLINAFKFTRTKVKISINEPVVDANGLSYFSVSIEDDGIGIPQTEIDNIFTKFFKVSSGGHHYSNLGGTGIGLALAKSLTEKHDGKLEVISTENVNTVFKVLIPFVLSDPEEVSITGEFEALPDLDPAEQEERVTVMVVEDDLSLNEFMVQSLKGDGFHVLNAVNGHEALLLLESKSVDLIISDVMMPVIDGMEFCNKVKTNINYSHIPLILLTARSNSESEIAGIENGADSYIIKPFKWKHVLAVVRNLLESRSTLKNKFAEQPFTTGTSLTTNNRDRKFMERVVEIIEERITDSQLSVEELSKDMNMSRSSLHKKLKSLSGYVPNEFIRLIRLKHAAKLILSNEYSISEISYMSGFNSHSYFSKCFVNQFKIPPSEFLEKHDNGRSNLN
jgi:ligand-binding sensor domain-containing protein/signal transduction histidine kinase/DNA-binding response OmpR family regulator